MTGRAAWAAAAFLVLAGCVEQDGLKYSSVALNAKPVTSGIGVPAVGGAPAETPENVYALPNIAPGARPAVDTTEAGLWMMMDRAERQTMTAGNLVRDERLNAYVRGLVCKLAGPYCPDVRVYVRRVPAFNANMAPNGMMNVWTGLLLRCRNEAQLATVLGHEIGHYLRRHSLQRMQDTIATSNALIFVALAAGAAGVPTAADLAQLIAVGSLQAYSRDNEREADAYGFKFLVANGYDPRETAKVWDNLIAERKADDDSPARDVFFASHPPSDERSQTLSTLAKKAMELEPNKDWNAGRDSYADAVLPHRAAFLRDDLQLRRFKPSEALIKSLIEDGVRVGELRYFLGELYRMRNDKSDDKKALEAYEKAMTEEGAPPEIYRSLGLVKLAAKERDAAKNAFKKYLELAPNAPDAEVIKHMMESRS